MLTLFLCWVLCIANVVPTGLTVWASEAAVENEPTAEEKAEDDNALQDSQEEAATEDDESADNKDTGQEPETPGDEEDDVPDEPGEDIETEVPEENSDEAEIEAEIEGETVEEIDGAEEDLLSTMAASVPENVIASGSYTENDSDTTWYIDKNGKLVVEGTGEVIRPIYPTGNGIRLMPWDDYRASIKTAEIKVKGMTDASCLFMQCENLTKVDLSKFDTTQIKNMSCMFAWCNKLSGLDVSGFDTSKVTNMNSMFCECHSLTSLDVSHFDTSNVTEMNSMFSFCEKLTSLDVSGFDTSKVKDMNGLFLDCEGLTSLDVSHFDTSNVTDMEAMFQQCEQLRSLDVSNFDTSKVTNMYYMFAFLESIESLDLSNFDTSNVTDMRFMFLGCEKLKVLDVSGFDTSQITDMSGMFSYCDALTGIDLSGFDVGKVTDMTYFLNRSFSSYKNLKWIYTPRNLKVSAALEHENSDPNYDPVSETWYMADGTPVQELPRNLDYSIVLTQDKPSSDAGVSSISVVKKKRAYSCGDTVNVDDITVTYRSSGGSVTKVTDFKTNASEIDMTTPGKKTLRVTYTDPQTKEDLTAEIELTVTLALNNDSVEVILPEADYTYNSRQQTPVPVVTLKSGSDSGKALTAGADYTVSYRDNINKGQAAVIIKGVDLYSGTVEKSFAITPAKVTIRVKDTTIAVKDPVPETFACEMTGFFNGDEEKVTELTFSFADAEGNTAVVNTDETGTYIVTPTAANVGNNYEVEQNGYLPGILTVAEERVVYTVTFDTMGYGTAPKPITSIRSGQLISEPEAPTAEGRVFEGWYKDRACTKVWNFAEDTVQENTTLYARWKVQTAEGGIYIQEISNQTYTGSAVKPAVAVYAADGTLLKSGKDYTVKYVNNINADQEEATGGITGSLTGDGQEGTQNTFNAKLPYVEVKGKGNHTGTVYQNFHIEKADIGDGKGNAAAGFTLKYTDQLVTNAKNVQKPFSSLKYKKAMKAGSDYTVALSSVDVRDEEGNPVKGSENGIWTAVGTVEKNKYNLPAIPKGYSGVFEMTVTGAGNYKGEIRREVYVTDKASLMKNVTVTLGKNQKNRPYNDGKAVTLTPGYYEGKKYYEVDTRGEWSSSSPAANGNDLFTVKSGKVYLVYGRDYTVTYANNKAVGTAAMTVTGIGSYKGSKSATFKITGEAFKANSITVKAYDESNPNENDFKASMPYTGSAVTQNKVTLIAKATGAKPETTLDYGRHYTISYKNNIKKGTATMTFTAKPESGYSGSFKKTFKIGAVSLDSTSVRVEAVGSAENVQDSLTSSTDEKGNTIYNLNGTVLYTREGAKPSQRIRLSLSAGAENVLLKEGTDYTVSYSNNTVLASAGLPNKVPTMVFKGKGNYTGSVKVTFAISEAAMEEDADNLTVTAAEMAFDSRKADDYQYAPKITIKDGKKALGNKDYTVKYENCSQTAVKTYLDKLAALGASDGSAVQQAEDDNEDSGSTAWEEVQKISPRAVITAAQGSGYTTTAGKEIAVYLNIYETKLTGSNLYVVVSSEATQTTYKGRQVSPQVTVYYGDAQAVKAAKKDMVTEEAKLTGSEYGLTKLTEKKDGAGDYILTYGANLAAGKGKGSVTVSGTGKYGGSVTVKFDILSRNMYEAP